MSEDERIPIKRGQVWRRKKTGQLIRVTGAKNIGRGAAYYDVNWESMDRPFRRGQSYEDYWYKNCELVEEAMAESKNKTEALPANERHVRMGGLMRCCLGTLAESIEPSEIGTVLSCKYESNKDNRNMIVATDGVWEWNRPAKVS